MKVKSYHNIAKSVYSFRATERQKAKIRARAKKYRMEQSDFIDMAIDAYEREQKRLKQQGQSS